MPSGPSSSKLRSFLGKRFGRALHNDEVLRLATYARALKVRNRQQMIYKPRMELWDDENSPFITAVFELPGLRPEEVAVDVVDGRLIVSGERRQRSVRNPAATAPDTADNCIHESDSSLGHPVVLQVRELKYGFFRRIVPVPAGCTTHDLEATIENGMLTVSWPRQPREVIRCENAKSESESSEDSPDAWPASRPGGGYSSRSM
ncbi:hypothetical protein C8Q76DRAFT_696989 [Earliella scabrosa]|nr:hypothetical protein C8Q76DRAFT_696989 [Earliella scabrosa]